MLSAGNRIRYNYVKVIDVSDSTIPYCAQCETRMTTVLAGVDGAELAAVSQAKSCGFFKRGDVVFEQGGQPQGIYCVHSGKIKVHRSGDEGRVQIVRFAKGGDVLGYRALLAGEPHGATATALEASTICCIPRATFFDLVKSNGTFSMDVMRLLSGDLAHAERQIVNLAQKPVRERLAETLLALREVYGTDGGPDSAISVQLSREDLANVVGTAIETLVRTIADLKREELIATDKKKIRILDQAGGL